MDSLSEARWPITVTDAGPPLSLTDLRAAEDRMGVVVPTSFRKFLLTYNSGRPHPNAFSVPKGECTSATIARVEWFLGITGGLIADNDIEDYWELTSPKFLDLLPIAWDEEAKLLFMSTGGIRRTGSIYYYNSDELLNDPEVPNQNKLLLIAHDFHSFLRTLH